MIALHPIVAACIAQTRPLIRAETRLNWPAVLRYVAMTTDRCGRIPDDVLRDALDGRWDENGLISVAALDEIVDELLDNARSLTRREQGLDRREAREEQGI